MAGGGRGRHREDVPVLFVAGTAAVGLVAVAVQAAREHPIVTIVVGAAVCVVGVCAAVITGRRRPRTGITGVEMTDRQFTDRVAALMRAGGWKQVTVTAAMGHLGTDVTRVATDGAGLADQVSSRPGPARSGRRAALRRHRPGASAW